jgi:hypothetical protein
MRGWQCLGHDLPPLNLETEQEEVLMRKILFGGVMAALTAGTLIQTAQAGYRSYNARGQSMSTGPGCNDKQIQRSNEIACDRTR